MPSSGSCIPKAEWNPRDEDSVKTEATIAGPRMVCFRLRNLFLVHFELFSMILTMLSASERFLEFQACSSPSKVPSRSTFTISGASGKHLAEDSGMDAASPIQSLESMLFKLWFGGSRG